MCAPVGDGQATASAPRHDIGHHETPDVVGGEPMHRAAVSTLSGGENDANCIGIDIAAVAERPFERGALHATGVGAELGCIAIAVVTGWRVCARDELEGWGWWVEDEVRHASETDRGV